MKEFQNTIQHYLLDHEKQKKYLAVVLALSMLVTFIVPLILTQSAESMTWNRDVVSMQLANATASDGVEIVTDEYQKVTLLIGANKEELRGNTVEETLALARSKYLLGIASQFGVFLKGDFTCHRADVESRLAIGGSANLSDLGGLDGSSAYGDPQWGFEIANGDFTSKVSLENLMNNWDYADAIVQGDVFTRIVTQSHDHYTPLGGGDGVLLDKTFVIGSNVDITDSETNYTYKKQSDTYVKSAYTAEPFRKMDVPLIDFETEFTLMQTRSDKLAMVEPNGNLYFSKNSEQTGFSYDGTGSDDLINESINNDNWEHWNIAHFVYEGEADGTIAYFNISKEQWDILSTKCRYISFEGIPEGANIVVSVGGEEIDFSLTQFTFINGVHISNNGSGKSFNYKGTYISNDNNGNKNNHESCEQLLYNFHDATSVTLYNNIAGNIYAPYAHVDTVNNPNNPDPQNTASSGHLSGALVALSFEGSFEFGYRPYQGTIDLLGSTSGYTIPVDKFKTDGEAHLAGADFSLTISDASGTVVTSWKSGDDTEYVTIPTQLDFTGGVTYTDAVDDDDTNNLVQSRTYTVKEVLAPPGYLKTEKTYTLTVTETVNPETLLDGENGGKIPKDVDVVITIKPNIPAGETNVGSTAESTLTFSISDVYDEEAQTMRKITIGGKEFWLVIKDQKVAGLVQPTSETTMVCSEYDGTVTYKTMITTSTEIVHESLVTETSYTDVPLLDAEGSEVTNENSETVMSTSVVEYPKTVAVETEIKTVTDENNEPVLDEVGSTITEVVVLSTDTVTETYTEISEFDIESDAWKNTTYTTSVGILETTSLVADPASLSTNGEMTFGDTTETTTRYYFDPNSLMIMPMPKDNLEFINEYGFKFEKTDEDLKLITGATIALEKRLAEGETEPTDESELDANNGYRTIQTITASQLTIDPDILDANTLYRFRESVVPAGYEPADPIYVVKFDDGSIAHIQSETEPTDIPTSFDDAEVKGWARFQINENYTRTIRMIDQKIHGYKLVLNKQDSSSDVLLDGAYFELHAANGTLIYPLVPLAEGQEGFHVNKTLDLFTKLKNAAPETYDSKYVNDGYLVKGTYYLEEVKAPDGYEKAALFRFKVDLIDGEYVLEALSSDAPQHFVVEGVSTSWANEVWAYVSATDVTKIEIQVASPEDGKDIILYQDISKAGYNLHEKRATVVNGVATFEFENALSSIFDFKIANGENWSNGVTVTEVRIYGTESEGGSSSGSSGSGTATPYTINVIAWSNGNESDIPISKLTFYYSDGTYQTEGPITSATGNAGWNALDISKFNKSNVIGMKFETGDSPSGNTFGLFIQQTGSSGGEFIWGGNENKVWLTGNGVFEAGTVPKAEATPSTPPENDDTTDTPVSANTAPLEVNEDGELVIPNSRLGADVTIGVQKEWSGDEDYAFARPDSITVELYQATSAAEVAAGGGTLYETVTLNSANSWSHSWKLPRLVEPTNPDNNNIYYYYVKEINVPNGYEVSDTNNDGEKVKDGGIIHIKNTLKTITINVKKDWDKPSGASTPSSVTVKLQYSADGETGWTDLPDSQQTLSSGNNWTYSYEGLPSNYFYKAVEVNVPNGWESEDSAASKTDKATLTITNKLITGEIRLLKNWENDDAKHRPSDVIVKLYRTISRGTSSGGSSSGGGSAEGDTTGGNTEVTEDAVVARFLYQKGNGYTDHDTYWGPPESQPSRADQMYWTTNSASDIAADYAAALAQFAVNFPDDDKSENYLNAAKALYDFSTKYNSHATDNCSGFYPAKSCTDEQAWAAAWLYLATNDTTYKTDCKSKLDQLQNTDLDNRGYFWDDVVLGAEAVYAAHIDKTHSWDKVTGYLTPRCQGTTLVGLDAGDWGTARHNALLQTLALVTDKNRGTTQYQEWCKQQMSLILGNNNYGTNGAAVNLVIGFADNSIKNPHHRAATGTIIVDTVNGVKWDDIWNNNSVWDGTFGEESHVLVGALSSGPRGGKVTDNCRDHTGNEVALDYNAGLVGAAAGLYSVYGTGTLVNNGADIDSEVESKYDGFTVTRQPTYTSNITEDYSRLLQYSLYFYDANMCGDFTEENSAFSWRSACHTDDTVDGGFHDAGDHVMFGLPQGFSASTLGWVYYEFRDSFDSLGQTAHYKTIMEEFCDFFVDSIEFEEPSQQTLTLNNTLTQTQSQKATAIKGISQVGSDKVAKGAALTVSGSTNGNTSKYSIDISALTFGDSFDISFTGNDLDHTVQIYAVDANYSKAYTIPAKTDTTITITIEESWKHWSGADAPNTMMVECYYYSGSTFPTITAAIHDDGPVFGLKTESATLKLGERITLETENATDGGTVSWTSSHPDYVTVANGVVQAVKYTSEQVTITAKDESTGSTATAKITVSPMTISDVNTNWINIGGEVTATIGNPGYGDTITWTASPQDAAAVKDGTASKTGATFVAYKAGTFTIVATDGNGNTATSEVITVNGMSLKSGYSTSLDIGGQTTLELERGGYGEITWSVSPTDAATITPNGNSATITANKGGDFYVTATDTKSNSITSNKITVNGPSITAPDHITEGLTGTITIGGLTGSYTVKLGDTVLTGSSNSYNFTAPAVDVATQYTISVVMNNETVTTKVITVNPFAITQDGAVVTEYGGTATLTANAPATWSVQNGYSGNITLTPSSDGMSCVVNGLEYTSDTITVTATYGENSDSAAITMSMSNSLELSIVENKTAIRIGDIVTLNAVPGNNVTYSINPADKIRFDKSTMQITALAEGSVTITGTRNGTTSSVSLTIHPALTLTGDADDTMNVDEEQTLSVNGKIGTITWEIVEGDSVTLDAATGKVKAVKNGVTTIKATDSEDNAYAEFTITVKQSAVNANIPTGAVHIADIEITGSGDQWTTNRVVTTYNGVTALDLEDLPLTDGNGNTYYYYIEEILDGNETLVTGNAVYIPTSYENNGAVPSTDGNTISVENTKISDVQSDGQMPSAGGEGTTWYYIAGAAMMLAGIAGYFVLKRKQASER